MEFKRKRCFGTNQFLRIYIVTVYVCAIHLQNKNISFDKPTRITCGFAILKISKTLMYDFYYRVMKKIMETILHYYACIQVIF